MPTVLNSICLIKNIEYIPDKIVTIQMQKMPRYNLILLISLSFMINASQINKQIFEFGSAKKEETKFA